MKSNIKDIVGELLELEPSLKGKKKDVEKIVKQLLESKPGMKIDVQFKNELRYMLKQKIQAGSPKMFSKKASWLQGVWYALGGAVMASLILTPGFYFYYSPQQGAFMNSVPQFAESESALMMDMAMDDGAFEMEIAEEESMPAMAKMEGFAPMEIAEEEYESGAMEESLMLRSKAPGIGAGGGSSMEKEEMSVLPIEDGDTRLAQPKSYRLAYEGVGFEIEGVERNIYKRGDFVKSVDSQKILEAFSLSNVDTSSLDNLNFESLTLFEDEKYGKGIQLSQTGEFSIQQNWRKWPDPYANCTNQACYDEQQMTMDDVPSDEKVVEMAMELVNEYGIDVTAFGEPEVDTSWKDFQNRGISYIPDTLTVTFPEELEGKPVYEQGGNKSGVKVNVSLRYKRASAIWGMNAAPLESEVVEIAGDANTITKLAEGGGSNMYVPDYAQGDIAVVGLAQPEEIFVKMWDFDQGTKVGTSVYVPALRFELMDAPKGVGIYQYNVFVPLVEKYREKQGGYPELMREGH